MRPPQAQLLAAWERGLGRDWIDRGLVLLGLAAPDETAPDLSAVPIGARDRALLGLRESLFGNRISGVVACERCGGRLEFDCTVADLRAVPSDAPACACQIDGFNLRLRPPNSADLRDALDAGAESERLLAARCIAEASRDGTSVAVASLPAAVVDATGEHLAALDPQADMRITFACPDCATRWQAPFDIVAFLWNELESLAQRLLDDVHELACAYGWSERAILDLAPSRRQRYLNRVRG